MSQLVLILVNIRSTYNVGAILRSAGAFAVQEVAFVGYTPHPRVDDDQRLPHIIASNQRQIAKTSLGAEAHLEYRYFATPSAAISTYRDQDYLIAAVEQAATAKPLHRTKIKSPVCLLLGSETTGLSAAILNQADQILEIGLPGRKESLNVAVAAGIVLYQLTKT